jgi:uncharacterized protein YmfQ (DUF2313 family)/photosystem II stability/assembly factor-like uncharacterized protein
MAFVDAQVLPVEASEGEATFDATNDNYLEPLLASLPRGKSWPREGLLRSLCHGLAMEFSRVVRAGETLLDEIDPATTRLHLPDYERVLDLPDCAELPEDIEGRRAAVGDKLRGALGHTQALGWWEGLAENLGLELWGYEAGPGPFTVLSSVVDKVAGEEWEHVFTLTLEQGDDEDMKVFECQVHASMSLEVLVVVHWRWNLANSGTVSDLLAVEVGKGYIVAAGAVGAVRYSADHGKTWQAGAALVDDVFGLGYNDGHWIAGSIDGGIRHTLDPEVGPWIERDNLGHEIYAVDAVRAEIGAFQFSDEGADAKLKQWHTLTNGESFVGATRPLLVDMFGATHDDVAWVQVGAGGTVFRSVNLGATWSTAPSGVATALRAVDAYQGTVIAVGDGGVIRRSENSGATWAAATSGTNANLYGVASYGGGRWIAVGVGLILESDDDGETWAPAETQPTAETLRAVVIYEGRAVIVGDNGTIVTE